MQDIIEFLKKDYVSLVIPLVVTLISFIYSLVRTLARSRKSYAETKELHELLLAEQQNDNIEIVNSAAQKLPEGLSKDEYFSQLRSILSDVSYSQFKNSNRENRYVVIEKLIQNHHEQAILQASVQFWFSLIASVVGFIFIIVMILMANNSQWYEYIFKVLPGTIIEAVSLLFFKQSSEIRERASDFLNRLRNDDQIAQSIIIADSIDDEKLRASVKAQIALHICGISELFDPNNNETKGQ